MQRETDPLSDRKLSEICKRFAFFSILTIGLLFVVMSALALIYGREIHTASQWVYTHFGFIPLALIVYISDMFISPIPPDLILVIIANSELAAHSTPYVGLIATASTLGGICGWCGGRFVAERSWVPEGVKKFSQKNRLTVERYGVWAVILGALTPLPFSITCWSAGFVKLPFRVFVLGAVMRFPRVFVYYWAIESANWVPSTLFQ